jgi:signal transduction histidine kinase
MGNSALLTQCFSNLLNNALKFVAPGKRPEVRVYAESRPGVPPSHSGGEGAQLDDRQHAGLDRVRLWVEDNGIGIPEDCRGKVFEMFQQLMPVQYPGTGIGLAIVKKAVERMRGTVGVESHPEGGSRFWLDLEK